MSRRRRVFDVHLPEEQMDAPVADVDIDCLMAQPSSTRRGPMAAAITEAASSLHDRATLEAEVRAENDALAHELVRLRALGLTVELVPAADVLTTKLTRDRRLDDTDVEDLKASIKAVGLSNPIRVEADGQGRYELVQGFRRLTAYRELYAETGDDAYARIPAGVTPPGETMTGLYRRMVDENLVRAGISFAEMAMLAQRYADDGVDGCADADAAVDTLYASVGAQKRSYIRRFTVLLNRLDGSLHHPEAISRDLGLAVAERVEHDEEAAAELRAALERSSQQGESAQGEIAALRAAAATPSSKAKAKSRGAPRRSLSVDLRTDAGPMRLRASAGRFELRGQLDFGRIKRARLERAVSAFLAELEE